MIAFRERLAGLCHDQWCGWMRYLFNHGKYNEDGTFTIDADKVERWARQMITPYTELSKREKDSDRKEADKFLAVMERNDD